MRDRQCALNHDATESLSLSQMCHKQTEDGRIVYITCIPTTCCGEISKSTIYKLLRWLWPRPLREHSLITRLRLHNILCLKTHCGGLFCSHLTTSLSLCSPKEEFWKSVSIWRSYEQQRGILPVLLVLTTDSLLCDMLVTFGSFVCYIK